MRAVVIGLLALAATACASKPAQEQLTPTPVAASEKLDEKLMAAQAAGYEVKDVNGEKLYCRREMQTGSHARFKTSCLTEREWEQLARISRQNAEDMARRRPPPRSN